MNDIKKILLERDGGKCSICGRNLIPENMCIDHVFPKTFGGSAELSNLRLLSRNCNLSYVNKSFNEFEFSRYIYEIIQKNKNFRNVRLEERIGKQVIDILAERKSENGWETLVIEVKVTTTLTIERVDSLIEWFKEIKGLDGKVRYVFVFPGKLTEKINWKLKENEIEIWDREYLVSEFKKEIEQTAHPIFNSLLSISYNCYQKEEQAFIEKLKKCKSGKEYWSEYQKLVGQIITFLFCPPLLEPITEKSDANKVNRRDFIFPNYCDTGFWAFLRSRYAADYIVVDAKNYSGKINKKEVLQISNYLKYHGSGLFGIIVTRNGGSDNAIYTLREKWALERKMIIILQDNDIEQMLLEKMANREPENVIRQKIEDFRLSL